MVYPWVKAFHIVFMVTWFAGLFYLPRLFVYHAETNEPAVRAQFKVMERRLMMITHVGAALTVIFGFITLTQVPIFMQMPWLHAKLALVAVLIFYHGYLVRLKNAFARDEIPHSPRWLRLFNEVPALLLIAIVILVVVKPGQ
jgi:putative membrane protein